MEILLIGAQGSGKGHRLRYSRRCLAFRILQAGIFSVRSKKKKLQRGSKQRPISTVENWFPMI